MFWGDLKEKPSPYLGGQTPRHAMQTLGTEWGRELIHPDLWTNVWKNKVQTGLDQVVTEDLRHKNEAEAVRSLGGKVIRIMRPGTTLGLHSSEREYERISVDHIVFNDSTPERMLEILLETLKL
jgi:hypothetical protein